MNVGICVKREIKIYDVGDKLEVDATGNSRLLILVTFAPFLVFVHSLLFAGLRHVLLIFVKEFFI